MEERSKIESDLFFHSAYMSKYTAPLPALIAVRGLFHSAYMSRSTLHRCLRSPCTARRPLRAAHSVRWPAGRPATTRPHPARDAREQPATGRQILFFKRHVQTTMQAPTRRRRQPSDRHSSSAHMCARAARARQYLAVTLAIIWRIAAPDLGYYL